MKAFKKILLTIFGSIVGFIFIPFKGFISNRQKRIKSKYLSHPDSVPDKEAHLILKDLAWEKYNLENYKQAEFFASELLRLNKIVPENWNYGNAIHHSHTIIGLVKLKNSEIESAKKHLIKSSKTPGSPQLDSFGPSFILAQKIADLGEISACKAFLKNCGKFWKMDNGNLSNWLIELDNGHVPKMYTWQ